MSIGTVIRTRFWEPVVALLRQGLSPARLAVCLALGAWIGVIPVLGVTTIACTLVALVLRLNLVAIQAANWVIYPLQFVLFIPFFAIGARLFGVEPPPLAPSDIQALIDAGMLNAVRTLWDATMHAIVAWAVVGGPVAALAALGLTPLLRRFTPGTHVSEAPAHG